MRKIKKKEVKIFFVSVFVTALFILFGLAMISAEMNTRKTGLTAVYSPLSLEVSGTNTQVVVNDRKYNFSVKPIFDVLTSKAFNAVMGLWFLF